MNVSNCFKNLINYLSCLTFCDPFCFTEISQNIRALQSFGCHVNIFGVFEYFIAFLNVSMIELVNSLEPLSKVFPFILWHSLLHNHSLGSTLFMNGKNLLLYEIRLRNFASHLEHIFQFHRLVMENRLCRLLFRQMSIFGLRKVVALGFQEIFKVFSGELDHIIWSLPDNFLRIGLEYSWKVWVYIDLICFKDPHFANVCHLFIKIFYEL